MKFVRLNSNFPVTKVENNLKKANYYKDGDEAYTIWDVGANIAVIACVFVVYFMYAKKAYRDNMTKIAMFLGSITTGTQKIKKANPNKKKGKWAGKHY